MNKGFTLIEVLAVIIILTGLTLIIVPVMNSAVKEAENKVSSQTEKSIILASKNWASDNQEKLPETNEKYTLKVSTLEKDGYIDNDSNGCVIITNKENTYYYKYKEEC